MLIVKAPPVAMGCFQGKALRPMLCAPLNWKPLMRQSRFLGWMVMSWVGLDGEGYDKEGAARIKEELLPV